MTYLEHANITVPDVDEAVKFLQLIDPTFVVRHQGKMDDGVAWLHVGNDEFYIAVQGERPDSGPARVDGTYYSPGINHLGWVVDDVLTLTARLEAAGYTLHSLMEDHPFRKRRYVFDHAGFEWEFVEYLSDDAAERNQYE
jgi:catechol 2,3-dioxygenase-like lactoylglutathione lyase family enzyme